MAKSWAISAGLEARGSLTVEWKLDVRPLPRVGLVNGACPGQLVHNFVAPFRCYHTRYVCTSVAFQVGTKNPLVNVVVIPQQRELVQGIGPLYLNIS